MIPPPLKPIHGVIFDLDGTLYHMKWYMRMLFFIRLFPKGQWLPMYMKVRSKFAGKDFGSRKVLMDAIARDLAFLSKKEPQIILDWFDTSFYPGFIDLMKFFENTRPGVEQVLAHLRAQGIKTGILSDFSKISERLHALSINAQLFDSCISSEDEGALKPCARPFQAIIKQWNIPVVNILVIGDRDDTDGAAARVCGTQFLQITDKGKPATGTYRWNAIQKFLLSLDGKK
jgi:FMN phosphatase YigB (HAD superfamily)